MIPNSFPTNWQKLPTVPIFPTVIQMIQGKTSNKFPQPPACWNTKSFRPQKWRFQVPYKAVLGGWGFPYRSRIHTAYIGVQISSILGTWTFLVMFLPFSLVCWPNKNLTTFTSF